MAGHLGRETIYDEPLGDDNVRVLVTREQKEIIYENARKSGIRGAGPFLRALGLGEVTHPNAPHPSQIGTDSLRIKFLTKAPCGDWKEAIEFGQDYVLSPDVTKSLEAQGGDVIVQADGDSMNGARIFDGDEVLMRPLDGRRPARGQIALVQIFRKNGVCEATIKHWYGELDLRDGDNKPFSLGKDVERVEAVAVARGLIARL